MVPCPLYNHHRGFSYQITVTALIFLNLTDHEIKQI